MFPNEGLFRNVFFQPYNDQGSARIQSAAKDSKHLVQQLCLEKTLSNHKGCIKSVHWNDIGSLLLTVGIDKHIVITNPFSFKVIVDYETKHESQILCAKFLPTTDNRIISCYEDGNILNLDLHRLEETEWNFFTCHSKSCYALETIPGEPNTFLSGSEDGTVCQFDLRSHNNCYREQCKEHVLIDCGESVSTIAINPMRPHQLAIATRDNIVRIVDRRKKFTQNLTYKIVPECTFTVPHLVCNCFHSITSLAYSPDGRDLLARFGNEDIYLFSLDNHRKINAVANDFLENAPSSGPISLPSADSEEWTQSSVRAQMSDTIVEISNGPINANVVERTTINSVFNGRAVNAVDQSLVSNYIEQSTSNNNNQRDEIRVILKTNNKSSRFDDVTVPFQPIKAQYKGHQHGRYSVKEATFWGNNFIMAGSDCGHVFVWDRYTCEIVMLLLANSRAVNRIQPHPSLPILATSGVGPTVKLWSSTARKGNMFSRAKAKMLTERNVLMNERVKDKRIQPLLCYYNHVAQDSSVMVKQNAIQARSNRNGSNFDQPTVPAESSEEQTNDSR